MLKVVQNLHRVLPILVAVFAAFLSFQNSDGAFADPVTADVNVQPSLTVTIPSTPITLNLNPASTTSGNNNITITVGTNNATGYKTVMTSRSGGTDLVDATDTSLVIPTLDTGTSYASLSAFPANHWGYKQDSGNYKPFETDTTILENSSYANVDTTTLNFATKIDYLQEAGAYSTTLVFDTVVNPWAAEMQNLDPRMCTATPRDVLDTRDGQIYTIQRFSTGDCWMTKNLLFTGTNLDPSTTNVNTAKTISYGNLSSGNSFTQARYAIGTDNNGDPTVWYNYAAASAMNIASGSTTTEATESLCPAGWRLPTNAEGQALVTAIGLTPSLFNPVSGGIYYSGAPIYTQNGTWYASTAYDSTERWYTYYDGDANELRAGHNTREMGRFIRCVLKDTRTISDITNMQDINHQIAANTPNNTTATIKDTRNGQTYTVKKFSDGSLWMIDNLRLTGTVSADGSNFVGSDFNVSAYSLDSSDSSYTNHCDSTNGYNYACAKDSGSQTNGVYYNFYAASAGTISTSSNTTNAAYDICPAGWRLPTYSEMTSMNNVATVSDFNGIVSKYYLDGTIHDSVGVWWSSTYSSAANRYQMQASPSGFVISTAGYRSRNGFSIRCVAK